VATPPGQGGVAIVRLSGPLAAEVLTRVTGRSEWDTHRLVLCWLGDPPVDQALAVLMRAPRSFTGEDVAELHVHGGSVVADAVVQLCLERGARLARPGEF